MGNSHAQQVSPPRFVLRSAGLKQGPLIKHDIMLDCRSVMEPTNKVSGSIQSQSQVMIASPMVISAFKDIIIDSLKLIPHRRRAELDPFKREISVLTFCAYGVNRSVAVKRILGDWLQGQGYQVEVQ